MRGESCLHVERVNLKKNVIVIETEHYFDDVS